MRAYLLKMKLSGIKNIDKEVEINFYNKVLKKNFELANSNIKAIYGANGSGKSAIIAAVDIYTKLVSKNNFLVDSNTLKYLHEIVNKKLKKFKIEMTFELYDEKTYKVQRVITHSIFIKENDFGDYNIAEESMFLHIGTSVSDCKGKVICECKEGKIVKSDFDDMENIKSLTTNLLKKQSIISVFFYYYSEKSNNLIHVIENEPFVTLLFSPLILISYINVEIPYEEEHIRYYNDIHTYNSTLNKSLGNSIIANYFNRNDSRLKISSSDDMILINEKKEYKKQIKNLSLFLKIFKSDIKGISVAFKENDNFLICEKSIDYQSYRVSSEYESNGIKKLIRLYSALQNMNQGGITFIDEFDANLHDVYLCKLIEYLSTYASGQLCFTTHNLAPMEVLSRNRKHAIDFLSDDATLTSWKRQGNYSAVNLYRSGMIEDSPFNIEPFDFLGVFGGEEST